MSLIFKQVSSGDEAAAYLADTIGEKLRNGQRVLWLVPGGSAIAVAAEASRHLQGSPLENLTVTLTDERYGDVGHTDSNWPQLLAAGFELPGAQLLPVLHGKDMAATVQQFAATLKEALANADYRIGLFGIGNDGHAAGILPHSSAVDEIRFAHGYDGGTFKRITMTRPAITQLDEAVIYAIGKDKWPVLDRLETDVAIDDQPAQIVKQVPKVTIFNDHKGQAV
jgi:6-phosphogluconolactonase/glucosamine-6-phosphate isomerase/deaminase